MKRMQTSNSNASTLVSYLRALLFLLFGWSCTHAHDRLGRGSSSESRGAKSGERSGLKFNRGIAHSAIRWIRGAEEKRNI